MYQRWIIFDYLDCACVLHVCLLPRLKLNLKALLSFVPTVAVQCQWAHVNEYNQQRSRSVEVVATRAGVAACQLKEASARARLSVVHDRLLNLLAAERRGVRRLGLGLGASVALVLCARQAKASTARQREHAYARELNAGLLSAELSSGRP